MLTETQFEALLEKISWNQQDRERMVRMETKLDMIADSEARCRADMLARIATADSSSRKAHERIDTERGSRLVMVGACGAFAGIVAVVTWILKLTGKM